MSTPTRCNHPAQLDGKPPSARPADDFLQFLEFRIARQVGGPVDKFVGNAFFF